MIGDDEGLFFKFYDFCSDGVGLSSAFEMR